MSEIYDDIDNAIEEEYETFSLFIKKEYVNYMERIATLMQQKNDAKKYEFVEKLTFPVLSLSIDCLLNCNGDFKNNNLVKNPYDVFVLELKNQFKHIYNSELKNKGTNSIMCKSIKNIFAHDIDFFKEQ